MKLGLFAVGVLSLAVMGCEAGHDGWWKNGKEAKEGKEENEVKVSIDQVPAAVKATLDREAPGVAIKDVDKESDEGKIVYEADAMIGAQNYEIKVAEDGTLIKKAIDNEADEKGEKAGQKGEKGEKDEKGEH